jgi:L-alanine-DL-glutamate epimerase-like enolase superfamily enzyme
MSTLRVSRRSFLAHGAAASAGWLARPAAGAQTEGVTIREVRPWVVPGACFVQVVASNGVSGWGECDADNPPIMAAFVENSLKKHVLKQDPWDSERLWDTMFFRNHDHGPGGALANSIAGVDIALWDLKGKLLGVPVFQLLGGQFRDRIRAYGSFGVGFGKNMTPEQAAAQAQKLVRQGFTVVKLRMQIREINQNPDPDPTFTYAAAVRKAIGPDIGFFIDGNNGYSAGRGIEVARRLKKEFDIILFEEPASDQSHHETAEVVRAVDTPIIAGEKEYTRWQHRELITLGNPDYLNPDTVKAGGLTEMKRIAAIAQAYGKPIICHNTRPTLSTAAALHFISSIPNCGPLMEFIDLENFAELRRLMKGKLRFENGHLYVPTGPGLGLEVDEAAVTKAAL